MKFLPFHSHKKYPAGEVEDDISFILDRETDKQNSYNKAQQPTMRPRAIEVNETERHELTNFHDKIIFHSDVRADQPTDGQWMNRPLLVTAMPGKNISTIQIRLISHLGQKRNRRSGGPTDASKK